MRNISIKFNINVTTYLFFLLSFLCGFFKNAIIIFIIVFIHEIGHVLTIKLCRYKIIKVEFFPFGGITRIDKPINSSINKEMLIAISGILFQILLGFIIFLLQDQIRDYQLFQLYNFSIFLFNLIPIIPLDGSIFIHSLLEKFYPYEKAFLIYKIVSWIMFFLFLIFNIYYQFNNYFICVVLLTQFYLLKKQEKYIIHRFYLERFLKEYPYKKIENHKEGDIHLLKKETKHYFFQNHHYQNEREMIEKYLRNRS